MSPDEASQRVQSILVSASEEADELLGAGDTKAAKHRLDEAKRDLRDLKMTIAEIERDVRQEATERRQQIASSGQALGLLGGSKARSAMSRGRAAAKRNLAQQRTGTLAPWISVKNDIDRAAANLDRAKAGITAGTVVAEEPAAAPPPPPVTPATWAPDPFGRHEVRYWGGSEWTEHVSDGGVQAIDPPQK